MRDIVQIIGAGGAGVSAKLPTSNRAWASVIFQQGKRPIDAEMNLAQAILLEQQRQTLKRLFGSGLIGSLAPSSSWSYYSGGPDFHITYYSGAGPLAAIVDGHVFLLGEPSNGWTLRAVHQSAGTPAPPRYDLVFLECWFEEVQPTIASDAASETIFAGGDFSGRSGTHIDDLVVVPGTETSRRIQARYCMRVVNVSTANQASYPNGMDAPGVLPMGGSAATTATPFSQDASDPGLWVAGDGSAGHAASFRCVDGYVYAIPLAWVYRSVSGPTFTLGNITSIAPRTVAPNTDMVDGYHANQTPTAGYLLPLDGAGKFPASVIPTQINADTVDTFHASLVPAVDTLLPLDGAAKFPNSVLYTGSGMGLDADTVDGAHASATPAAGVILILDGAGKIPNTALRTGSGQGLDVDQVDGYHASQTPTANTILVLDAQAKIPNTALRTGSGQGLDVDQVDGYHASQTPTANTILVLDGSGKIPNTALKMGSGQGLDADTVDGYHASSFALASHTHNLLAVLNNNTAWSASSIGTSYTQVYSTTVNPTATTDYLVQVSFATNDTDSWSGTVYVDGVQASGFMAISDQGGDGSNTYQRVGAGLLTLAAGSHTISVRVKGNSSTISSMSGGFSLFASAMA